VSFLETAHLSRPVGSTLSHLSGWQFSFIKNICIVSEAVLYPVLPVLPRFFLFLGRQFTLSNSAFLAKFGTPSSLAGFFVMLVTAKLFCEATALHQFLEAAQG
jgi:hypothetical protein